jgi:hypothetical protein
VQKNYDQWNLSRICQQYHFPDEPIFNYENCIKTAYYGVNQHARWNKAMEIYEIKSTLYHKYPEQRSDLCINRKSPYSKMCDVPHWIEYSSTFFLLTQFLIVERMNYFIASVFTLINIAPFIGYMLLCHVE